MEGQVGCGIGKRAEAAQSLVLRAEHMAPESNGNTLLGQWRLSDVSLWQGAATVAYKAKHRILLAQSIAVVFKDIRDLKCKLAKWKKSENAGEHRCLVLGLIQRAVHLAT